MIGQGRHESQPSCPQRIVYYTGSTALVEGQAVFYDLDYVGTEDTGQAAADPYGRRGKTVVSATTSDNVMFAGVCDSDYRAQSHEQPILINEPGGWCKVAVNAATTMGTTYMTAICSSSAAIAGRFGHPGLIGRGTALAHQTLASATTAPLIASFGGTHTVNGTALTGTGFETSDQEVAAGDKVLILAGKTGVTIGEYTVSSVTNNTTIVLTSSASTSSLNCIFVIYRANPKVLAYLYDGEESHGVEYVWPQDGATRFMVGGTSLLAGGVTPDGNPTLAMPDGVYPDQRKKFALLAGLTGATTFIISDTSDNIGEFDGTVAGTYTFTTAEAGGIQLRWVELPGGTGIWGPTAMVEVTVA